MLPDISVFGRYTYLVTIVFWGAIALGLLYRTGMLKRAAVSLAVLYPIGFVWDWYTLTVGIFDIILHTEIYLLGIPLEEHLFIIVVPALVIGVHETVQNQLESRQSKPNREGL